MAMELARGVGVVEIKTAPAAQEHVSTQPGNGQPGKYTQPRIELFRHDVSRGIKGDGAQRKDSRSVRSGDDQTKQQRMSSRAARADQVGGYDRFAVAGFQRVQRAQSEGDEGGGDQEPETQAAGRDQLSERAAWGRLLVRLEM